jgi:hypothetical protein
VNLLNDPSILADRMAHGIDGLDAAMPQTSASLALTAARAVGLLRKKINVPDRLPLDGAYVPSKAQILTAAKYLRVINNPYRALDEVRIGNLSKESKEVLADVFPELYEHLREKVMQGIAAETSKGRVIPQNKRISLASFLNQELDSGMKSETINKNWLILSKGRMEKAQQQARPAQVKHLTIQKRLQTPLQRVAER